MNWILRARNNQTFQILLFSSFVSLGFLLVHSLNYHSTLYWYLGWNLILAWFPLIFVVALSNSLQQHPWLSWRPMVWTLLWLAFLPNSFYIISDLLHLQTVAGVNVLYDTVMMVSFMLNGLVLGYLSLFKVHELLIKRINTVWVNMLISLSLLLCSYAIYLGRDLRWSSWDLLINPQGILFDISNQFINPRSHLDAFTTTAMFFVLLGTFYYVIWKMVSNLRLNKTLAHGNTEV